MSGRKTLEVNPNHPVIIDLLAKIKADKEDTAAKDTAQVSFQTALIESGYELTDASALVNRVYRLMAKKRRATRRKRICDSGTQHFWPRQSRARVPCDVGGDLTSKTSSGRLIARTYAR